MLGFLGDTPSRPVSTSTWGSAHRCRPRGNIHREVAQRSKGYAGAGVAPEGRAARASPQPEKRQAEESHRI